MFMVDFYESKATADVAVWQGRAMTSQINAFRKLYAQISQANLAQVDERISFVCSEGLPYDLLVTAQSRALKRIESMAKGETNAQR